MALSILMVRALVEGVENAGVGRESFLSAAGVRAAELDDGDARVSLDEYDRLVNLAIEVTGDEALGLRMGEGATVTTYSLAAHLVAHAKDLRHGIDALVRYHRLLADRSTYRLVEEGETATLLYELSPGSLRCRRFRAELTLAGLLRMVQFFGRGKGARRVCFEHEVPPYASEYRRLFDGTERFGQDTSSISFERALLDAAQLHADPEFHSALETQAQYRVLRLTGAASYKERLLEYLLERATAECDMSAAAQALGLSVRTLRRRLTEEGVSFTDLSKQALSTRAKQLVCDVDRTIDETAYLLGFSDRSAFHRAFKRWTGVTPKEYRCQRRVLEGTR